MATRMLAVLTKVLSPLRALNNHIVNKDLRKLGLLKEDLYNDSVPEIETALSRISEAERQARNMRLLRAADLQSKHQYLPKELQNYDVDRSYLGEQLKLAQREIEDRARF
eukprot:GILK01003715.1.p1 GENE.GILK01003715.1~~GILK01003715.1.p1  ORF type:complete len:110 (-),score=22.83 GILK01003715.1:79-408(-)